MYVTPDLSGVENKILGAAAQPLGAKTEILGVAAQSLEWRRGLWRTKKEVLGLALAHMIFQFFDFLRAEFDFFLLKFF